MKAPKLVKTKKSQLKVPVTTAGRKMQFYRNSNSSASQCQMVLSASTRLSNGVVRIDDDLIGYSIDGRAAQYSQGQAGHIHGRRISEEVVSSFFPLCF